MTRYASDTSVPVEKSKAEIERILVRYGADEFMSASSSDGRALIGFVFNGIRIDIRLQIPRKDDPKFHSTPSGRRRRDPRAAELAWEQACRAQWRALALVIKAKLEAVESGISTLEEEFLAWVTLPNGASVGQALLPQLNRISKSGTVPRLLPATAGAGQDAGR